MGAREFLNSKPWLGWVFAGVLLVAGGVMYWRLSGDRDPYSVERLSQTVTIRCIETGDEWEIERGMLERELRRRPGLVNEGEGLINPNTGRPTGFPVDKMWEETVERINAEKRQYDPSLKTRTEPTENPESQEG